MFNIGPIELLFFLGAPLSGLVAAVYLGLALRKNQRDAGRIR
jgi:hypothetical protein